MLDEYCDGRLKIFNTRIPTTVKVGEANMDSVSILDFDAGSKASTAYTAFAKEVMGHAGNQETITA